MLPEIQLRVLCVFFAISAGNTGQTFARVQICMYGRVHVNVTRDHDNVHTRTFTHEQTRTRMNKWTFQCKLNAFRSLRFLCDLCVKQTFDP